MIPEMQHWERQLVALAEEGFGPSRVLAAPPTDAARKLKQAYSISESITAEYSRSFHFASRFLPPHKRRAVRALYAFCRITDDIVDEPKLDAAAELAEWRREAISPVATPADPVALAWSDTQRRFQIPVRYAEQLIEGVGRDLSPKMHESFDSLAQYCYGVASTVGLMSMHIIGYSSRKAVHYAVKMGVALQLTNILRDVGEDLRMGRLYLPLDELAAFEISSDQLHAGRVDRRWRKFMRFQVGRARRLFDEAWPGIRLLHRDGRLAVAAAAELYGGILREIEANGYDVFAHRAHLSATKKLTRLPGIWLRTRLNRYEPMPREVPQ